MRVFSPISRIDEVENIIRAGANELYCGVLSRDWLLKYTIAPINRRAHPSANLKSFDELKDCVELAHSYGIPVSLTINEHYYTKEQYPLLIEYIQGAINTGVDRFIISDLGLLLSLREMNVGVKINMSTGGATFNSETAKFYQRLGASGVTLDRHLTISEMRDIVKNVSNLETYVFILNSRCANVDGLCTFQHFASSHPSYTNACMLPFSLSISLEDGKIYGEEDVIDFKEIVACVRQHVWERFHIDDHPCGACSLYEFNEMGITSVKIVGRGQKSEKTVLDTSFIRILVDFLKKEKPSKEEFKQKARALYMHLYRQPCRPIMCYYASKN